MTSSPIKKERVHIPQTTKEHRICNGNSSPYAKFAYLKERKNGNNKLLLKLEKEKKAGEEFLIFNNNFSTNHFTNCQASCRREQNASQATKNQYNSIDCESMNMKENLTLLKNHHFEKLHNFRTNVPAPTKRLTRLTSPQLPKLKRTIEETMKNEFPIQNEKFFLGNSTKTYLDILQGMKDLNDLITDHASSILEPSSFSSVEARDHFYLDQSIDLDQFICNISVIEERVKRMKRTENVNNLNLMNPEEDDCDLQVKLESDKRIHKYKLLFSSCNNAIQGVLGFVSFNSNQPKPLDYQAKPEQKQDDATFPVISECKSREENKRDIHTSQYRRQQSKLDREKNNQKIKSNGKVIDNETQKRRTTACGNWVDFQEKKLIGNVNCQLGNENMTDIDPCFSDNDSINMSSSENVNSNKPKALSIKMNLEKKFVITKQKLSQDGLDLLDTNEEVKANCPYSRSFVVKKRKDKFIRTFQMEARTMRVQTKLDTSYDNSHKNKVIQYYPISKSKQNINLFENATLFESSPQEYSKKWNEMEPIEDPQLKLLYNFMYDSNNVSSNENTELKRLRRKLDLNILNTYSKPQLSCESLTDQNAKSTEGDEDLTPEKYPNKFAKRQLGGIQYSKLNHPIIKANCQIQKSFSKQSNECIDHLHILSKESIQDFKSSKPMFKAKSQNEIYAHKCLIF